MESAKMSPICVCLFVCVRDCNTAGADFKVRYDLKSARADSRGKLSSVSECVCKYVCRTMWIWSDTHRQIHRQTERQTDRQTHRQTDTQTDRQTDRHLNSDEDWEDWDTRGHTSAGVHSALHSCVMYTMGDTSKNQFGHRPALALHSPFVSDQGCPGPWQWLYVQVGERVCVLVCVSSSLFVYMSQCTHTYPLPGQNTLRTRPALGLGLVRERHCVCVNMRVCVCVSSCVYLRSCAGTVRRQKGMLMPIQRRSASRMLNRPRCCRTYYEYPA